PVILLHKLRYAHWPSTEPVQAVPLLCPENCNREGHGVGPLLRRRRVLLDRHLERAAVPCQPQLLPVYLDRLRREAHTLGDLVVIQLPAPVQVLEDAVMKFGQPVRHSPTLCLPPRFRAVTGASRPCALPGRQACVLSPTASCRSFISRRMRTPRASI